MKLLLSVLGKDLEGIGTEVRAGVWFGSYSINLYYRWLRW